MKRDRIHWVWLWLATLIAWCAIVATAAAQTAPPVSNLQMSPQVSRFLDSLANDAREHRIENGACVTSYAVRDSTLWLEVLGPAHYTKADSLNIWGDSEQHYPGICPMGQPSVHTHVAWDGLTPPSDTDRRTAAMRGMWNLLLQSRRNGWLVFVY